MARECGANGRRKFRASVTMRRASAKKKAAPRASSKARGANTAEELIHAMQEHRAEGGAV
jgi:hypothetical protein